MACACIEGWLNTTAAPAGSVVQIGGLDCYVTEPPAGTAHVEPPSKAVVLIPDVFGE